MTRACKIFKCQRMGAWLCCHDCTERSCANRCQNSPDRCRCCDEAGIVESPVRKNTLFDYDQIIDLAKQGMKSKDIAAKIGCSPGTVSRVLLAAGIRRYKGGDDCG